MFELWNESSLSGIFDWGGMTHITKAMHYAISYLGSTVCNEVFGTHRCSFPGSEVWMSIRVHIIAGYRAIIHNAPCTIRKTNTRRLISIVFACCWRTCWTCNGAEVATTGMQKLRIFKEVFVIHAQEVFVVAARTHFTFLVRDTRSSFRTFGTVSITNIVLDATIKSWLDIFTYRSAKEVVGWKNLDLLASVAFTRTLVIFYAAELRSTCVFNEISIKVKVRFLVPARAHVTILFAPFPLFEQWLPFFACIPKVVPPLELTREGATLHRLAG
jgi:hypothetical protein